jgi:rubredoxin
MVTTQKLPANVYETLCPRCGARVEFPLFQSSFYDFATYEEAHSGQIFRLDLDACHYRNLTVDDLLAQAQKLIEGQAPSARWIELPKEVKCHRCGEIFPYRESHGLRPSRKDCVDAYAIPAA